MRSRSIPVLLLSSWMVPCYAQWTQQTLTPFGHVFAVHATDAQTAIATGATGRIYKTTNSGSPWLESHIPDPLGAAMTFDTLYGAWMLDAQTWVAAGYSTFEVQEIIIRTTNAGTSWDVVHMGPDYTGCFDMEFISPTEGFAVGKQGRILHTTDAGASWSVMTSPGTGSFFDLTMFDAQTGFIAAANNIIRTTNNGSFWSVTHTDPDQVYENICAASTLELYASGTFNFGNQRGLWRSTDGGTNWMQLTPPFEPVGALYSPGPGIVMCASTDLLYVSYNSGEHWYYYPGTDGPGNIQVIRFSDAQHGFAAGYNGTMFHTENGGGPATPLARFTMPGSTICPGQSVSFTNISPTGLAYEWSIDGVPVSNAYDGEFTFDDPGDHLVSLEVADGGLSDTYSLTVTVLDPPLPSPFTFYFFGQTQHCQGSNVEIHFAGGEQYYQARVNGAPLTPWTLIADVDFDHLILNDVDSTCVVEVVARRISCDTTYLSHSDTLWVMPMPDPGTVVSISDTFVCVGDTVTMTVENSEIGIVYEFRLQGDWQPITEDIVGNGGPLVWGFRILTDEQVLSINGSNALGCQVTLAAWTVVGDPLQVNFTPTPQAVYTGGSSVMDNESIGNGSAWVNGGGAVPPTSTMQSPTVTFPIAGLNIPITLTEANSAGCSRSLTRSISVMDPAAPSSLNACFGISIPQLGSQVDIEDQIMDMAVDGDGNTIITGWSAYDDGNWYGPGAMIAKFDGNGDLLWSHIAPNLNNIRTSSGVSVAVDLQGDVYMAGFYTMASLSFAGYSLTGPSTNGRHSFIIKFSPAGDPQWLISAKVPDDDGMGGIADVLVDADQSLWFPITHGDDVTVTFADGTTATYDFGFIHEPRFRLFHVSSEGTLLSEPVVGAIRGGSGGGEITYSPDEGSSTYWSHLTPCTPQLFQTCQGEIGVYTWTAGSDIFPGAYGQEFIPPHGAVIGVMAPNSTCFDHVFSPFRESDLDNTAESGEDYRAADLPVLAMDGSDLIIAHGSGYGFPNEQDTIFIDLPDGTSIHEVAAGMVMRLDPHTGERLWMDQLRGMDVHDIAVGADHRIHVFGRTRSHFAVQAEGEAPVGVTPISIYDPDVALLTLSPSGHPVAVDAFSSSGKDNAFCMAADACGNIALCGYHLNDMTGGGASFPSEGYFLFRGNMDGPCDTTICASMSLNDCANAVCQGDDVPITWTFTGMSDAINIGWHASPSDPLTPIASAVPVAQGAIAWDAPDNLGGATVTVVITDINNEPLDSLQILFALPFELVLTSSPDLACAGDSVQISAPTGLDHYAWSVSLAESDQVHAFEQDTVYCTVQHDGCTAEDSIIVHIVPDELSLPNDTAACSGLELLITADPGYQSYTWSNGITAQTISIDTSGLYTVEAIHEGGCISTDTIDVQFMLSPDPQLLSDGEECAGNNLTLDPGYTGPVTFVWHNGVENNLIPVTPGGPNLYWVIVTGYNGCSGSDSLWVTGVICTGIDEPGDQGFRIFPDPCTDVLRVEMASGIQSMHLFDLEGRSVRYYRLSGERRSDLNVRDLAPGAYELRINAADGRMMTARFLRIP